MNILCFLNTLATIIYIGFFFNNLKNFVYFIPEKTKSCGHKTVLITATGN